MAKVAIICNNQLLVDKIKEKIKIFDLELEKK